MKLLVISLFLGIWGLSASASRVYDATSLLTDPSGSIELIGNKSVRWNAPVPQGAKLLFEDTMPGANWGHPAKFKLVSKEGKVLNEQTVELPPVSLKILPMLFDSLGGKENNGVEYNLNTFEGKKRVSSPENFHAVFINGRADRRHWNDFSFFYRVLTQIYGFNPENITVADGNFIHTDPDLDGDLKGDIKHSSRLSDVEKILADLAGRLGPKDHLIVAVNDHGSTQGGESTIVLYDTEIKASAFGQLLSKIKAGSVLSIYEQCFSGGFVRPSVSDARVSMAAATDQEYSWASMDLRFDEFIYHVIVAFAQQTPEGVAVKSDVNSDGRISAQEAFAYAVANDLRRESPVLESQSNQGDAANLGVNFSLIGAD